MRIVLIESDQTRAKTLAKVFFGQEHIRIEQVSRVEYFRPPEGLDALFLSLPAAERWGSKPIPFRAQILPTSSVDQQNGMPKYIVSGVAIPEAERHGSLVDTQTLLRAVFDEIRRFNAEHSDNIRSVGFFVLNLLDGVDPVQLGAMLESCLRI